MKRICILTAGHLSTCPRMLKAADALADAGYAVRVVSTHFIDWAAEGDRDLVGRRPERWRWSVVDYDRRTGKRTAIWSAARSRLAVGLSHWSGARRCPFALAARATVRVHPELVKAVLAEASDLIYAGGGATAPGFAAARRAGIPFAIDLEDFHSAQSDGPEGRWQDGLTRRVEERVLRDAAFLTAGSEPIAGQYERCQGVRPIAIHNVFPLPDRPPAIALRPPSGLRLYWFSQTIGEGRGLEEAIGAMGLAGILGQLDLRGRVAPGYEESLRQLAAQAAPRLRLHFLPPSPPDTMVEAARDYDVGLTLEQPGVLNRDLCLTNKAFTYLLAGLAVAMTSTTGQRRLAEDLGPAALVYPAGEPARLAAGLRRWWEHPEELLAARRSGWEAAQRRWHWEHPLERGRLLDAVAGAFCTRL